MPSLKRSLQLAKANHHRTLLLLAGNSDLACNTNSKPLTWKNNRDLSDQINDLLGSETNSLIFDASHTFDERLFAASAGTVLAGGILILLTPPLTSWAADQSSDSMTESLFIKRLIRKIQTHSTVELEAQNLTDELGELINLQTIPLNTQALLIADTKPTSEPDGAIQPTWQSEQAELVDLLLAKLNDASASTVVVQANRGRGKSALIGEAIKQFLIQNPGIANSVTVTSSRRSACEIFLKHAKAHGEGENNIPYVSLDQAISMKHKLLIVEEAGSVSLPMLSRLTELSENIVFATTVQGYEGAGRGFALRFSKTLNVLRPNWIKLEPVEPIRWAKHDPVEAFVNDALMLDTQLASKPPAQQLSADQTHLARIDKHDLCTNDQLLEAIFSLLVQAHYQTTPADLRHFLDQETIQIYVQRVNDVVTGAALVAREGEIPTELHQAIVEKQRRIPDQILPQLLAQSAATTSRLDKRYARIIRIAIHPELHRQGFGSELMNQLSKQLSAEVNFLGASFGADHQTLAFWLKQGYQAIHYGYQANAKSGLRSACVLTVTGADKNENAKTIQIASDILHHNLKAAAQYDSGTSGVKQQLIDATANTGMAFSDTTHAELIRDFCLLRRSFFDTCGFIQDAIHASPELLSYDKTNTKLSEFMQLLLDESTRTGPKEKRAAEQALRTFLSKSV